MAASQYGHMQVVETLLKHGANIHDQLYVSVFHGGFRGTLAAHSTAIQSQKWHLRQQGEKDVVNQMSFFYVETT